MHTSKLAGAIKNLPTKSYRVAAGYPSWCQTKKFTEWWAVFICRNKEYEHLSKTPCRHKNNIQSVADGDINIP